MEIESRLAPGQQVCCKARKRSTTVDESASSSDDRTEVIEHLALRSDWASSKFLCGDERSEQRCDRGDIKTGTDGHRHR